MNKYLKSHKTLDMSTYFKLSDLIPYISWAVPLHDSNALAYIGRIIVSYTGTKIKFKIHTANNEQLKCCCSAPDGSFYTFFASSSNNKTELNGYYVTNYGNQYKTHRIYNWNNTNTNPLKTKSKDMLLPNMEFIAIGSSKKKLNEFKTPNKNILIDEKKEKKNNNNNNNNNNNDNNEKYIDQNGIFDHIAMIFNVHITHNSYSGYWSNHNRYDKGSNWYDWKDDRSLLGLYGKNKTNESKFKVIENLSHINSNNIKILYLWRQILSNKIYMIRGADANTVERSQEIHEFNIKIRKQQIEKEKDMNKKRNKRSKTLNKNGLELKNNSNKKKNKNKKLNKRSKSIILSDEQAKKKRNLLPTSSLYEISIGNKIKVKKLFSFPAVYLTKHCVYYNIKYQSLLLIYNDIIDSNVKIQIVKCNKNTKWNKNNLTNPTKVKTFKKSVEDNNSILYLKYPKVIGNIFEKCKCEYLFYYKMSNDYILVLKKDSGNRKDDINKLKCFNSMEKKDLIKHGRFLMKLKISFDKLKVLHMSLGVCNIEDKKLKIIMYDYAKCGVVMTANINDNTAKQNNSFNNYYYTYRLNHNNRNGNGEYKKIHKFIVMRLHDMVHKWNRIF